MSAAKAPLPCSATPRHSTKPTCPQTSFVSRRTNSPKHTRRPIPALIETMRSIRDNVAEFQQAILHTDVTIDPQARRHADAAVRAAASRRRLRARRSGGLSFDRADDGGSRTSGRRFRNRGRRSANSIRRLQQDMLATCHELGVTEVYRIGGAQAVAALAYGCDVIRQRRQDRRAGKLVCRVGKKTCLRHRRHRFVRRAQRSDRHRRFNGASRLRGGRLAGSSGTFTRQRDLDHLGRGDDRGGPR